MSSRQSDERNESAHARRASFSPGSTLTELFTGRVPPPPYPGPNTIPTQRNRRMSVSGLPSASIGQPSSTLPLRRGSVSSVGSSISTMDENAVEEDGGSPTMALGPFARRMSWGTRGLRDVRIPGRGGIQPPGVSREYGKGSGSQSPPSPTQPGDNPHHQRRPSASTMPLPVSSMPTTMPAKQTHDPLQERILKGDFYMD